MANAFATIDIRATPAKVWQLIGGFNSLPDWLPDFVQSTLEEGGRVRRVRTADGQIIVDHLLTFSDEARSYSYRILRTPFPQKNGLATLRVHEIDDGKAARVEWFSRFDPVGLSDAEAAELFRRHYADGLAALARHFAPMAAAPYQPPPYQPPVRSHRPTSSPPSSTS